MNINFILAGSNNNNFPVEKEFPLNTEPNDNLSLNIEPVEDLNNTSFSNGFLSVHNELSDDINLNKEIISNNKE
ncbi:unnamed protein product [Rhizophagus irregularis]|nr:unnamed protein product [Rhizophagus irregularis]